MIRNITKLAIMAALTAGVDLTLLLNLSIVGGVVSVLTGKALRMKKLYLLVTKDEYELPIIVTDCVKELAEFCGDTVNNILSCISHAKKSGGKSRYVRVEYEVGEDEEN